MTTPSKPARPVWTFVIKGGSPFRMTVPSHPALDHDGSQTIWKGYVTDEESDLILRWVQENNASIVRYIERESEGQKYERDVMSGKFRDQTVFQTEQCPSCFWFDPMLENRCGLDDWEPVVIEAAMTNPTAPTDRSRCPANK